MAKPLPVLQSVTAPGATHLVEVGFKGNRRDFFACSDDGIRSGEYVIVDVERGQDLGRVRSVGGVARSKCGSATDVRSVVRRAEAHEVERLAMLRSDEERVRRTSRELVVKHALKMKVSETEWQWDRSKLIIYFTADRRVDFRQLVRDLARTFRTRIELKQIGVRDEAALLGGVGRCGRQLCCATWLREIKPVSLQLAKDQNLSLNPAQISGTCGRLMCCLTYEHDMYLQARKRFPRDGKVLRTARGEEKVIGIDIWRDQVTLLDTARERRIIGLAELKKEIDSARTAKADSPGRGRPSEPPRTEASPRSATPEQSSPPDAPSAADGKGAGRSRRRKRRRRARKPA